MENQTLDRNFAVAKTDSDGDTFVKKYGKYTTGVGDHLYQLEKNYESAFGEIPTAEELKNALKFVYTFLAEIGETKPGTRYAKAVSDLTWIIDEDNPVKTAENIYDIPCKNKYPDTI